jgi:hypothetical protein
VQRMIELDLVRRFSGNPRGAQPGRLIASDVRCPFAHRFSLTRNNTSYEHDQIAPPYQHGHVVRIIDIFLGISQ